MYKVIAFNQYDIDIANEPITEFIESHKREPRCIYL